MAPRAEFHRMVLRLPKSSGDFGNLTVATQLAELMRLNLIAAFVEDASLMNVAGLPGARELRLLGGGWRPIEVGQLAGELQQAMQTAQRLFGAAVRHCSVETSFQFVRGPEAERALATVEDVLVVFEPRHPAERITRQFATLLDAALKAAAATLIVPSTVARSTGPIIAIPSGPDDPSLRTALAIAGAARERVVVVSMPELRGPLSERTRAAEASGIHIELMVAERSPMTAAGLTTELSRTRERLLVLTRGTLKDSEVAAVPSLRRVPVFVLEPAAEPATAPS